MSKPNASYSAIPAHSVRTETLRNVNTWIAPTPAEISTMLSKTDITWEKLAALTGQPETDVADWHHGRSEINYMAWRFICERAGYGRIDTYQD